MSSESSNIIAGLDECLPITHHDVYPAIDPEPLYAARSYGGKVVLITGASRGIGRETALHYARAGASVAIVARTGDALNETKNMIVAAVPGADVLVLTADVRDIESVRSAVDGVLGHFGKLDILVANAGAITSFTPGFDKKDPNAWWNTFEVNVRGVFNVVSVAIPALEKTQGYIVAITSLGAQLRVPGGSDGCITKHAVNRLVEFIALGENPYLPSLSFFNSEKPMIMLKPDAEHPSIRVFALAPGYLPTRIAYETGTINESGEGGAGFTLDTLALPASTMLHLTSGRLDWLSGRFYSANWDMAEVEREWKDMILQKGGLVNKLYIPRP